MFGRVMLHEHVGCAGGSVGFVSLRKIFGVVNARLEIGDGICGCMVLTESIDPKSDKLGHHVR